MVSARGDAPLVMLPQDEKPRWTRIGVLAAVGFAVGILWPRLLGVKLGPDAPGGNVPSPAASASAEPKPEALVPAPAVDGSKAKGTETPKVDAAKEPSEAPQIQSSLVSCRNGHGDTKHGAECEGLSDLLPVLEGRLKKLAACTSSSKGKLVLLTRVDFGKGTLHTDLGKGGTVARRPELLECARTELSGIPLSASGREFVKYTISTQVNFGKGFEEKPEPGEEKAKSAEAGDAEVVWEVGIVRSAPRSGAIVTRLPRGSALKLGAPKDGWYPVRFGQDFSTEGWVYRGAIGK